MATIINVLLLTSKKMGYLGIIFLMTIESSFVPFPSEIIIPPAAYLAHQGEMNILLVILSGVAGSLIGALINYYLAITLGRKMVYALASTKLARLLLISEKKVQQSEAFFIRYGGISTFTGRLLPGIRQLISIPAGLSKMKMSHFLFFTTLGSGIWTVILGILGWTLGANQELLKTYYREISLSLVIICVVVIAFYVLIRLKLRKKNST